MAVLLGLADGELGEAVGGEMLAERAVDGRGRDEEALGRLEVAVVLHHAGIEHVGALAAIEVGEGVVLEGLADLDGPVAAEVEEHHRCPVANRADGLAAFSEDHERRQHLVADAGVLAAQRLDGLRLRPQLRRPTALQRHLLLPLVDVSETIEEMEHHTDMDL